MSSYFPSQSFFWVCPRQNKPWLFTKNSDEMANPQFKLRSKRMSLVNKFTHCSLPWKLVHFSEGTDPLPSVSLCYCFLFMGLWITPISLMWRLKNPRDGPALALLRLSSILRLPETKHGRPPPPLNSKRHFNTKSSLSQQINHYIWRQKQT